MPLTGIFLLPPTLSSEIIRSRLYQAFPNATPSESFSLRHSLYRATTDAQTQLMTMQAPASKQASYLHTLTLSTRPGCTALLTVSSDGVASSAIHIPSTTSSGIAAFGGLVGTKMAALWTPVRQHDLDVLSLTAGSTDGGRTFQVGAFEMCIAEIVPKSRGQAVLPSALGDIKGVRGVALAVRLAYPEDTEVLLQGDRRSDLEDEEHEKAMLRDFRMRLDLKRVDEGGVSPATALIEEFWGDCTTWQGETALWCELLRHRALSGMARMVDVGR